MAGEGLLEAAGQNFGQAGEISIESQNARTKQESVEQEPRLEETRQINENLRTAMGEKTKLKEIQVRSAAEIRLQLLKSKMGETTFPPELAIQMAKDLKDPSIMQMSGMPMNNRLLGGWIAEKYKAQSRLNQPKFQGNMMVTRDADGNEVMTDMRKHGFIYRPTGGGGGGSHSPENMDFKKKKEFNRAYEKLRGEYKDPLTAKELQQTNPDKYNQDMQWLQDNRDQYDTNVRDMGKSEDGGKKPEAGGESSGAPFDPDAFIKEAIGG